MRTRTPLIASIAFVVLFAVAAGIVGKPPGVEDSADSVVAWLRDNHDKVPTSAELLALAVIPFCVLIAYLRAALPPLHATAVVVAAGAFIAQAIVGSWFTAGLALHASSVDPATARTLMDVSAYFGPFLTTTDVVIAGAVAHAVYTEGSLPRWAGHMSIIFALEQLIETVTLFGDHGFAGPGGDFNNVVGAYLFGIWAIVIGVALSRATAAPAGPAGARREQPA